MPTRILIIDNNDRFVRQVQDWLADAYEVRTAENPVLGADILLSEPIDVLIVNDEMPEMSGYDFLRLVDAVDAYIRLPVIVIATTTFRPPFTFARHRAFLRQPVSRETLLDTIHKLLLTKELTDSAEPSEKRGNGSENPK
jgi:DNA-binding NtrC family response regulator